MKKLFLLLSLALTVFANAQDEKTVTLMVSGQGATQDEARQKALRSAIEQAFGAFISSKTEILNDNLVKDEIVSVANGNIQKYEPVSEVQLPDGGYASTLKATVSVTKLTSFCESKGVEVEFKGGLFALNIKQQQLNEKSEISAVKNLCQTLKNIADNVFDYSIATSDPKVLDENSNRWELPLSVNVKTNENLFVFRDYLIKSLSGIAMQNSEIENYISIKKPTYLVVLAIIDSTENDKYLSFYLRKPASVAYMQDLTWYLDFARARFIINDGVSDFTLLDTINSFKDHYELNVKFKHTRIFESNWNLYLEDGPYGVSPFSPPFGQVYYEFNPKQRCDNGNTYDFSKKNINLIYNNKSNTIKSKENKLKEYQLKIEQDNQREMYARIAKNDSVVIQNLKEEITKLFVDSITALTYRYEGYSLKGGTLELSVNKLNVNMAINLAIPKNFNSICKYTIFKEYTTDELSKISSFNVKRGKLQ